MKRNYFVLFAIAVLFTAFTSCENEINQPHVDQECPVFWAVVSGIVVNENGEPIPNVECLVSPDQLMYTDYDAYRKDFPEGSRILTDENGKFTTYAYSTIYSETPITNYLCVCFFREADSVNVGYEPLFIEEPIRIELIWNGIEYGKEYGYTTNNLFEPIDLGKFVMHEKK